jgi:dTDP-4-dehydrorhamnose 3,5-epimerase
MQPSMARVLPRDVKLVSLRPNRDSRGTLTELFRSEWFPEIDVVHMDVGICDLRAGCSTFRQAAVIPLDPGEAVLIPPGVAHGFYSLEPSSHVYSVTDYWDPADELGCQWPDPALGIPWKVRDPLLSPRDIDLPSLGSLLETLA